MSHKTFDEYKELETKLLSLGGQSVRHINKEDFITQLNKKGKLIIPNAFEFSGMGLGRCHENSALFYLHFKHENNYKNIKIMLGWGLTIIDVWCQHTWLYDPENNRIIETTLPHKKYFGYILTNEETEMFQSVYTHSSNA